MPNPYKARVDVRRFLNLPGFHAGAYVVAYVEDTSARELTKRVPFGYEGSRYVNPHPRILLEIADCSNRINLEFQVDSALDVENSLHKLAVLLGALSEFRAGLVEEARLYREREPEVARLNASPQQRTRRHRPERSGSRTVSTTWPPRRESLTREEDRAKGGSGGGRVDQALLVRVGSSDRADEARRQMFG